MYFDNQVIPKAMGTHEMPQPSNTERGLNAARRAQADDAWAAQVLEESMKAAAANEISIPNPGRETAKATAETELQDLREKVAADKARRAIVAAKVRALMGIVGEGKPEDDPAVTGKAVAELKTAQNELRDVDVATLMSEQRLAAREADYRKDFPETLN